MHVAHVLRKYNPAQWGGTETVILQLLDGLRAQGVSGSVYAPRLEQAVQGDPLRPYTTALAVQSAKLDNVALTPSARLLNELTSTGESFFDQALRMSTFHKEYFLDLYAPNQDRLGEFAAEAEESLERQAQLENSNDETFD